MSTEATYAAGDAYAVVGDRVTVLLPRALRDRVAALWELVDGGADAEEVLDALLAGGLSAVEHLALVAYDGRLTRVLVRGHACAEATSSEGGEVITAAPGATWAERLLTGVTRLRVTLDGDAPAEPAEHALGPGIARVGAVEIGEPTTPTVAATPAAAPVAEPAEPAPVFEEVEEAEEAEEAETDPAPPAPLAAPAPAFAEAAPVPSAPVPPEPLSFGQPGEDPTPTGEAPVLPESWSDNDGQTQAGVALPDFDRPPIPGQEIAPDVLPHPVASLVFSTGDVVAVDRTVLVGRAPEARRFASHDQPHVVTVPSPQQEISSTHLEIRPGAGADHGSAIATDLGSTNGTVVAQPGLDPEELQPGIAVSLIPGAVIDLGDGVTIQVTNP